MNTIDFNNTSLNNIIESYGDLSGASNIVYDGGSLNFFSWMDGFFTGTAAWFWWAITILYIAATWVVFTKAGRPGWAILIPIYGAIVYLDIVRRPWWWLFLLLIPFVNIVFAAILAYDLSRAFGREGWFAVGLFLLPWIFMPILAFGRDKYLRGKSSS